MTCYGGTGEVHFVLFKKCLLLLRQSHSISSFFASFIMMRDHFLVSFHGSRHPSITSDFHLPSLETESVFQGQPQKGTTCQSCGKHWRHWVFPNEAYRHVTQYGLWADA